MSTWLGWSQSPGDVPGFGPLDAADSRDLADALAGHPDTQWCLTLLDADGRPVAHGCAAGTIPHGEATRTPRASRLARARPTSVRPPPSGPPASGPPPPAHRIRPRISRIRPRTVAGAAPAGPADRPVRPRRAQDPVPSLPQLPHLVRVRRPTCTFPGCRQPARRCDIDHTVAFHHGGLTCLCNLGPLCRRHHRCKQAEGWSLSQPAPGEFLWTTPSGRQYTTRSAPYPQMSGGWLPLGGRSLA